MYNIIDGDGALDAQARALFFRPLFDRRSNNSALTSGDFFTLSFDRRVFDHGWFDRGQTRRARAQELACALHALGFLHPFALLRAVARARPGAAGKEAT